MVSLFQRGMSERGTRRCAAQAQNLAPWPALDPNRAPPQRCTRAPRNNRTGV